tara:strand:- start:110 stop:250 length:141 start_codon:yes stop_codon:yes gene_type:complete
MTTEFTESHRRVQDWFEPDSMSPERLAGWYGLVRLAPLTPGSEDSL